MVSIRRKDLILISCILLSVCLIFAQAFRSALAIMVCLAAFLALTVYSATCAFVAPVLLFFLPFAPLLKYDNGTLSFFSIALMAVYAIYIVIGGRNIKGNHLLLGLGLIFLIIIVKIAYGYSFSNSFILFAASLLLMPLIAREMGKDYDFYLLTLFFATGVCTAAITAQYMGVFPGIAQFIKTDTYAGITRRSGYYGDPNFYSAHITAGLSGILVLLNNTSKKRMISLIIMAMLLLYCGFLSISKSFFLIASCLVLMWIILFMFKRGKFTGKVMVLLMISIGVVFLLSSTVFTDLFGMMLSRFSRDNSISDFTTRRTDIWISYLKEFENHPLQLMFGNGFTNIILYGKSTHNTIIQSVFQFGIVGSLFLMAWFISYIRAMLSNTIIKKNVNSAYIIILAIGCFGPWMALDLLFFDEFFLIPIYFCFGISHVYKSNLIEKSIRT